MAQKYLLVRENPYKGGGQVETPPNNEIWYTSTDGNIVTPNKETGFGANIVSNTYENDRGVIEFDGDVTSIGNEAFKLCKTLTSITIGNGVTSIGNSAFYHCDKLASITLSDNLTSIGDICFSYCTKLALVILPSSITSINYWAFSYCFSLTSITIKAKTPPTFGKYIFNGADTKYVYVPSDSVEAYKTATNFTTYVDKIKGI